MPCKNYVHGGGRADRQFRSRAEAAGTKSWATRRSSSALVADWGVTPNGDVMLDLSAASRMFGQFSPGGRDLRAAPDRARHAGQRDAFSRWPAASK